MPLVDDTGKVWASERISDDRPGFSRVLELLAAPTDQGRVQMPVAIKKDCRRVGSSPRCEVLASGQAVLIQPR